jgi:hypothetical protein
MKTVKYYGLGILAYLQEAIATLRNSGEFDYHFRIGKKHYKAQFMGLAWLFIISFWSLCAAGCGFMAYVALCMLP